MFFKKVISTIAVACMLVCAGATNDIYAVSLPSQEIQQAGVTVTVPENWYTEWEIRPSGNFLILLNYIGKGGDVKIPSKAKYNGKTYNVMLGYNYMFGYGNQPQNRAVKTLTIADGVYLNPLSEGWLLVGLENCELIKIGQLNTSEINTVANLFKGSEAKKLEMKGFDTGNITSLSNMFTDCMIKYLDVSDWKNTNVTDMSEMFCQYLGEGINFTGFKTSKVTNMDRMFIYSKAKNLNVSGFDVSNVTSMVEMFKDSDSLESVNISGWKANKVTSLMDFFGSDNTVHSGLKRVIIGNFEAKSCKTAKWMFRNCEKLTSVEITKMNIPNCTDYTSMFSGCKALGSINAGGITVDSANDLGFMFSKCESLATINLSNWKTSNVTRLERMFSDCSKLRSVVFGNLDLRKAKTMRCMFSGCSSLDQVNMSGVATRDLQDMAATFSRCSNLKSLRLQGMNTSKVTMLDSIFYKCEALDVVDLRGLDFSALDGLNRLCCEARMVFSPAKTGKGEMDFTFEGAYWNEIQVKTENGKTVHTIAEKYLRGLPNNLSESRMYVRASIADEHVWPKAWAVCEKATCKSYEKSSKTCFVCGEKQYTYSGNAYAAHVYTDSIVPATYTKQGYTFHKCKVCGLEKKDNYKPTKVYSTKITKKTSRKKGFKIKWTGSKGATGYQIQYSTNKGFKASNTVWIKKGKTKNKTFKKLKANKKYYLRIRAYKIEKVDGKETTSYSAWSKKTYVKTKK